MIEPSSLPEEEEEENLPSVSATNSNESAVASFNNSHQTAEQAARQSVDASEVAGQQKSSESSLKSGSDATTTSSSSSSGVSGGDATRSVLNLNSWDEHFPLRAEVMPVWLTGLLIGLAMVCLCLAATLIFTYACYRCHRSRMRSAIITNNNGNKPKMMPTLHAFNPTT